MTETHTGRSLLDGVDLTDLDNFAHGFPHDLFALHRRVAPVHWHEPTRHTPGDEGFWSVATYDRVLEVLNDPEIYSSETGGDRPYGGTLIIDLPVAGVMLNMMDDPRHGRIRRLVTRGLTPAVVRGLEHDLRARTRRLLDRVDDDVPFDFLTEVAAELPMQAVCFLMGIPEGDRHRLFECVEQIFDFRDDRAYFDFTPEQTEALGWMHTYGADLIDAKRSKPAADMLSAVIHARLPDEDPPSLSPDEVHAFFTLLFSAGSETTRNAISGGLLALMPEQGHVEALRADPALWPVAVEEVLRWTTPSPMKRRTATRSVELGGHRIEPGEKVVIWEGSANRDEAQFPDADRFDIRRSPNAHLAFGHGTHFCLGAHLARLETRVALEELLGSFEGFELAGPVEWTRSNRHAGVRHLPMRMRRRRSR